MVPPIASSQLKSGSGSRTASSSLVAENASAICRATSTSHAARGPICLVDLEAAEGLLEVGDDIVSILTAYGHAQKALGHSSRRELGRAELPVARGGGVRDQGVDAAETRGAGAQLECVHDLL